jgi:RNA polymerase sigma factor (sigma-70 family)
MQTTTRELPIPLSAAQMYRNEIVQRLPKLSHAQQREREQALIERLKVGAQDAREELLLLLQPAVFRLAARFSGKHAEWGDLVNEANVRMLERMDEVLGKDNPCSYLLGVARLAMIQWISGRNDPIKRHNEQKRVEVISLDAPLYEDGTALADLLPEPHTPRPPETHDVALHQVIEILSAKYQVVVRRHYGFDGPPESLNAISHSIAKPGTRKTNVAYDRHEKALRTMRRHLAYVYA